MIFILPIDFTVSLRPLPFFQKAETRQEDIEKGLSVKSHEQPFLRLSKR